MKLIYYAHHKSKYNTKTELNEINKIEKAFNLSRIINPNGWIYQCGNENSIMNQCLKMVENCDILVFSTLDDGVIGKGVYSEIEHALNFNKEVYLLKDKLYKFTMSDYNKIKIIYEDTKSWRRYAKVIY